MGKTRIALFATLALTPFAAHASPPNNSDWLEAVSLRKCSNDLECVAVMIQAGKDEALAVGLNAACNIPAYDSHIRITQEMADCLKRGLAAEKTYENR